MQEAGLVEAQSGLDYLLSAASISLTDPHMDSGTGSVSPSDITVSKEARSHSVSGYATMSDIALDLSRIGPLNDGVFLRAMSGLTVMEK